MPPPQPPPGANLSGFEQAFVAIAPPGVEARLYTPPPAAVSPPAPEGEKIGEAIRWLKERISDIGKRQMEVAIHYHDRADVLLHNIERDYDGERLALFEARKELSRSGKSQRAVELLEEAVCQNLHNMHKATESAALASHAVLETQEKLGKVDRSKVQAQFIQLTDDPNQAEKMLKSRIEAALRETHKKLFVSDAAELVRERNSLIDSLYHSEIKDCREMTARQVSDRVKKHGAARVYLGLRIVAHQADAENKRAQADLAQIIVSAALEDTNLDQMIVAVGGTPKSLEEREKHASELIFEEAQRQPDKRYEIRLKKAGGNRQVVEYQLVRDFTTAFGEATILERDKHLIMEADEPIRRTALPLLELRLERARTIKREIEEEWKSHKGLTRFFQFGGFEREITVKCTPLIKDPRHQDYFDAFKRRIEFSQQNFYEIRTY